ncbi:hypothetical protein KEM52_005168, partial [Ascosphaera acerosa]
MATPPPPRPLNKERQARYFLRCLKTVLPTAYTSTDSSRMTLAFFVLASLDLLGALDPPPPSSSSSPTPRPTISESDRCAYIDWIYACQLPTTGGFRGSPTTRFSHAAPLTPANAAWDPANVAATFFALASLLLLRDDL